MSEFFSFEKAAERVPHSHKPMSDEVAFDSKESMDKSILLYTHILKSLQDRDPEAREAISGLISCVQARGEYINPNEVDFFLDSIQDKKIWAQVGDFYWSMCVIHYKIMTDLKLLDNLDHVSFRDDGTLRGVKNRYGRISSDGNTVLVSSLSEIVLVHFYKHMHEWEQTLRQVQKNSNIPSSTERHMGAWGHVLLAYLTMMTFGGGIVNYNKFVKFCLDNDLKPEMHAQDKYKLMQETFGIE